MISFLIGLVGSIMGCVAFFSSGSQPLLIIGAVLCIVEMLIGLLSGQLKSLIPDIVVMVIGMIIAGFRGYKLWVGAALGLCISTLVLSIFGIIMLIVAGVATSKEKRKAE